MSKNSSAKWYQDKGRLQRLQKLIKISKSFQRRKRKNMKAKWKQQWKWKRRKLKLDESRKNIIKWEKMPYYALL